MKKITILIAVMAITITKAQVSLVKDIHVGAASSMSTYENSRFEYNGHMYFAAYEDVTTRMELWKTDGTTNGTTLVKNLGGNGYSGNPRDFLLWSNEMILTANRITGYIGVRSDGTTAGTSELNPNGNSISKAMVYNNELYVARGELYKYTSINASPSMVIDLTGGFASFASPVIVYGGELYFTALNQYSYAQIWKTNGTAQGTSLVKEFGEATLNTNSGVPTNFKIHNGKLYFAVNGRAYASDPAIGVELWVTDGTTAGTVMVQDLNVGAGDSNPSDLTIYNDELYFTATSSALGRELFKVNSNGNIVNVFDIHPSGDSNPSSLFVDSNRLYYAADDGTNGKEIWVTNTYSGASRNTMVNTTEIFKDINPTGDSNPSGFVKYFGEIYFSANDGVNGQELWKSDLTSSGTQMVDNINLTGDSNPRDFMVANNQIFFSANNGVIGEELYKYIDPSLSVNDLGLANSMVIYPNPTTDNFSIRSNTPVNTIAIYNVQGKTVKTFNTNLEFYNIEELTSGLYFIKIQTENGTLTKKLIKK
ncbi:hypothetical protein FBALC1_09917 [Flavobacteriales bacterium ALC-1]|nr:hypothetical protein FBALC1_09917 [Flavobacteriales bacterium ALC-1]